jgi:cytochrome b involved in lipid metabolism
MAAQPAGRKKATKWFTSAEVALHNCGEDCWVSFLGKVCNLTQLIDAHTGTLIVAHTHRQTKHSFGRC